MLDTTSTIVSELEHSRYIRSLIRQGKFDFSKVIYKGLYWSPMVEYCIEGYKRQPPWVKWFSASPITYCPNCIDESIREFGFGYFKTVWWRSVWCRRHRKKLKVIQPSKEKTMSALILETLSGKESLNSCIVSLECFPRPPSSILNIRLKTQDGFQYRDVGGNYKIPHFIMRNCLFELAPCFRHQFLLWVIHNHEYLLDALPYQSNLRVFFSLFKPKVSIIYRSSTIQLADYAIVFFNLFCQEDVELFRCFIESNTFYVEKANLLMIRKLSCSLCPKSDWSKFCSQSRDIARIRLTPPVLRRHHIDNINAWRKRLGELPLLDPVDEDVINLASNTQMDEIHYVKSTEYICSQLDENVNRFERDSIECSYTLLGWQDLEVVTNKVDNHLTISLPLFSDVEVIVDDGFCPSEVWPEIVFDRYVYSYM